MSDFIFTTEEKSIVQLRESLYTIYPQSYRPPVLEYFGDWGALVVTESKYPGFQPLETDRYICIVIGGPVLYFHTNNFIASEDPSSGTRLVLDRFLQYNADWSEDVSGPFVILVIDKYESKAECITDLMLFTPVYEYKDLGFCSWGTHIDSLAHACEQVNNLDDVSLVDFILHNAITYPYTAYSNIQQLRPSSNTLVYKNSNNKLKYSTESYWLPLEENRFSSINEAAKVLREGVQGYINRLTTPLAGVAQFVSAGEDSRALAGLLPSNLERDGYIFLDSMNREGKVAAKVASKYKVNFKPSFRDQLHYLHILPEASKLIGSGHQYIHAHTLGFDKINDLSHYKAVFGGYIADSMLKGQYAKKTKILSKISFLPQFCLSGETRTESVSSPCFSQEVLKEVSKRRSEHYARIYRIRPKSAHEWFELWPATMRVGISNLYTNRRLFASHEIFMAKESVKVAASVPISWKLNRRLFNKSFKPALAKSWYIFHADGRLPYFAWYFNSFVQAPFWCYHLLDRITVFNKKNQGPWTNWNRVVNSSLCDEYFRLYKTSQLPKSFDSIIAHNSISELQLSTISKVNLLQCFYLIYDAQYNPS